MVGGSQNLPGWAVGKSMRIRFTNPLPGLSVGSSTERCQRRVPPPIASQDGCGIPPVLEVRGPHWDSLADLGSYFWDLGYRSVNRLLVTTGARRLGRYWFVVLV